MAKTKEELNTIKEEVDSLNKKLAELSEEDLAKVIGGYEIPESATINDIKIGDSVFAFDSHTIPRWGIVENIRGASAIIRFGGGFTIYQGKITQLEPETVSRSFFYLSAF